MKPLVIICCIIALSSVASAQSAPQQRKFQIRIFIQVVSEDPIIRNRFESLLNHDFRKLDGVVIADTNIHLQVTVVFAVLRSNRGRDIGGVASVVTAAPLPTTSVLDCVAGEKDLQVKEESKKYLEQFTATRDHAVIWAPLRDLDGISRNVTASVDTQVIEVYRKMFADGKW